MKAVLWTVFLHFLLLAGVCFRDPRRVMTVIILIETSAGYSVMPLDEFDGDPETIVSEYDPFSR